MTEWDDFAEVTPPGWNESYAPAGSLRERIRTGVAPDSALLGRLQAHQLIDRLEARGIRLHLRDGQVKWSTLAEPITIAEMRQIKRLTPALRTILAEGES